MSSVALHVISDFGRYRRGDVVTDDQKIAEILKTHPRQVVKFTVRDDNSTTAGE